MNDDYAANKRWLVRQCFLVEYLLATDIREGAGGLSQLILQLRAFEPFFDTHTAGVVQRLQALQASLLRLPPGRALERAARVTTVAMWEAMHEIDRLLRSRGQEKRALWGKRLYGVRRVVAAALVLVALVVYAGNWMQRDAAADIAFDFMQSLPKEVAVTGIHTVEHDSIIAWRWVEGPQACIRVDMPMAREALLHLAAMNLIEQQGVTVFLNGTEVAALEALPAKPWGEIAINLDKTLPLRQGKNTLCFRSRDFNQNKTTFAPGDPTPYAFAVTELTLRVMKKTPSHSGFPGCR